MTALGGMKARTVAAPEVSGCMVEGISSTSEGFLASCVNRQSHLSRLFTVALDGRVTREESIPFDLKAKSIAGGVQDHAGKIWLYGSEFSGETYRPPGG